MGKFSDRTPNCPVQPAVDWKFEFQPTPCLLYKTLSCHSLAMVCHCRHEQAKGIRLAPTPFSSPLNMIGDWNVPPAGCNNLYRRLELVQMYLTGLPWFVTDSPILYTFLPCQCSSAKMATAVSHGEGNSRSHSLSWDKLPQFRWATSQV